MLPPLDTPENVTPIGRTGLSSFIRLVAFLAKFVARNKVKIRAWLIDNTSPELVAIFDQLVDAIDAFYESIVVVDLP